ncbi:hypothetical protein [Halorussus halobius]|uniref:hypothetical protein n=1 Tax=Halorussus halobius TaxID=1710537 RepID=UPI001B2FF138|nr:hypothetical protein [Halorussus halobius]
MTASSRRDCSGSATGSDCSRSATDRTVTGTSSKARARSLYVVTDFAVVIAVAVNVRKIPVRSRYISVDLDVTATGVNNATKAPARSRSLSGIFGANRAPNRGR